jgi:8-oxo-dGTP pyrophosphatase MutT (NUDIX family)
MAHRLEAINNEIRECMTQIKRLDHNTFIQGIAPKITPGPTDDQIMICGHPIQIMIHPSLNLSLTGGDDMNPKGTAGMSKPQFINSLKNFEALRAWCFGFDPNFFNDATFTEIYILSVQWFGPKIGFLEFRTNLKFKSEFCTTYKKLALANGTSQDKLKNPEIPSIIFMRGASVSILIKIHEMDSSNIWSIMVVQPRASIGKYTMREIPAGMLDESETFAGAAAKEIEEETGITIEKKYLEDLTEDLGYDVVYPSCGGCDESMKFYFYRTKMSSADIKKLQGKCTGAYTEGENIKLELVLFSQLASKSPDMKTLTALHLYDLLMRKEYARATSIETELRVTTLTKTKK